ncbi:MAG: NTE family protein [Myxococcota bacterium]|jgi:NTE family protein
MRTRVADTLDVLDRLKCEYVDLIVIDLRAAPEAGFGLLDILDIPDDIEARYGFHRLVGIVGGQGDATDRLIADLGAHKVGRVLRDPVSADDAVAAMLLDRPRGRTAVCCSGGGITGICYEFGALKCLTDCLSGGAIHDLDLYFGVSAGAVVNGIVAAGYVPEELMGAILGHTGGRVPKLDLSLLHLSHLNTRDALPRSGLAAVRTLRTVGRALRRGKRPNVNDLLLYYTALVGTPFRSDRFGEILLGLMTAPGACNDFRKLPRQLFIGASDQDTREHRLFGPPGQDHIPIHRAIQASLSMNPAFSSVEIDGRVYEDGQVTRTSHFGEAVDRGADLILTVDPFVPYVSPRAGLSDARGMLYNIDQNVRSLSHTRFRGVRDTLLRKHPRVSSYTFLPSNPIRRVLSTNPMDHRPYLALWNGAYLSTLERLHALAHRLHGDLAAHGITLDTGRAEVVATQLQSVDIPRFEDFFVERVIQVRQPPLGCAGPPSGQVRPEPASTRH